MKVKKQMKTPSRESTETDEREEAGVEEAPGLRRSGLRKHLVSKSSQLYVGIERGGVEAVK